ncbi:MAG: hypothetical protein H6684_04185 [Deltaproteobacteria bacterium]|nr:hypothetical protein [Deltaproteobacteria bacterium]
MPVDLLNNFTFGLFLGILCGLAIAIVFGRLATSFRGLSKVIGRDPVLSELRDTKKKLVQADKDVAAMQKRLDDKDAAIRKAMSTMAEEAAKKAKAQQQLPPKK